MTKNSSKIRFAVVGTNTITDKVLAAAQHDPRFELAAVYSRTKEQADAFAAKYGIKTIFTSLHKMAASPLIDAVYIASPNSYHASQSILCMQHGKHVLCEKPLASNAREAKAMIEAANKNNVVLMEAMIPTLMPNFQAIQKHLKDIGTIRRYFACYCQYSSRYDDLKKGLVPNAFMPELSNGAVADIGIYTIYPMVVLFGRPKRINATGLKLSTGVDGQGIVNFEYEGMDACIMYSKIANSLLNTEIHGEEGTIIADRINVIKDVKLVKLNGDKLELSRNQDFSPHYYEIVEFLNLIETGQKESTINSHQNSLITIEIIDEIRLQLGVVYPADLNSQTIITNINSKLT